MNYSSLIKHNFTISNFAVIGRTGSGKTRICKEIIYNLVKNTGKINRVFVFCENALYNKDYDFLPKSCIHEPNFEIVFDIIKVQREFQKKGIKYNVLIILDDFISKINLNYENPFNLLLSQGRHIGITCILISQYINKLSTTIRENINYWSLTRLSKLSLDHLYDYQLKFSTKNEFWDYYNSEISKVKYSSIFINNKNPYDENVIRMNPVPDRNFELIF